MPILTGAPPTSTLTLGVLIESILSMLYGQTAQQDRTTALTQNIGVGDLSFTVEDSSYISAGLIEIDTELLRVSRVDKSTDTVYLTSAGRGVSATIPASHLTGAELRVQPLMTRAGVAREIQAELNSLFPQICQVGTYEFTTSGITKVAYGIPADAEIILDVRFKDQLGNWERVRRWEVEFNQNTTDFPTGIALRLTVPLPTASVRVIYGKAFGQLNNLGDTLSAAGVPASVEDILRLGATIRLLPTFDIARLSVISVPGHDAANRQPQPGTGIAVARELSQLYRSRLDNEITGFRQTYPVRQHLTR